MVDLLDVGENTCVAILAQAFEIFDRLGGLSSVSRDP